MPENNPCNALITLTYAPWGRYFPPKNILWLGLPPKSMRTFVTALVHRPSQRSTIPPNPPMQVLPPFQPHPHR